MIQFITGNIPYILKEELLRWKNGFILKQSELGICHIQSLGDSQKQLIRDTLLSRSFLSVKKLLILEDIDISDEFMTELFSMLERKDDDTIVLICLNHADKRLSSYKQLLKVVSKHTDYGFSKSQDGLVYLENIYGKYFDTGSLRYLFEIKSHDISKTLGEIQKLLVSRDFIDRKYIDSSVIPELDSTIFSLLDGYLYKNSSKFFSELSQVLDFENFYLISQGFLSNLRTHLYIEHAKSQGKNPKDIADILTLGNRSFLIGKTHKRSFSTIFHLYKRLIDFDSDMKRGKLGSNSDDDIKKLYRNIFLRDFT